MAEFGLVYARGIHNADRLLVMIDEAPTVARSALDLLAEQPRQTRERIEAVTDRIAVTQNSKIHSLGGWL